MNDEEIKIFDSFFIEKQRFYIDFCGRYFTGTVEKNVTKINLDFLERKERRCYTFTRKLDYDEIKKIIYNGDIGYYYFLTDLLPIAYETTTESDSFIGRFCIVVSVDEERCRERGVRLVPEKSLEDGIRSHHIIKDMTGNLTKAAR